MQIIHELFTKNLWRKNFGIKWLKSFTGQLPFKYRARNEIRRKVIDEFLLMDLKEWEEKYPQYPIYEK